MAGTRRPPYSTTVRTVANRSAADIAYATQNQQPSWQDLSSYRRSQATAVLDGASDMKFQYNPTTANIDFVSGDGGNWVVPFVHGLGYRPEVSASVYYETTPDERHPLPWSLITRDVGVYPEIGILVTIDTVDELYINVRFVVLNALGLSILLANFGSAFVFKFYCRSDTTI